MLNRALLPALIILDGLISLLAVMFLGAQELNPLCAYLLEAGILPFAAVKVGVVGLSLLLLKHSPAWSRIVVVVYGVLVVWDLGVIAWYAFRGAQR